LFSIAIVRLTGLGKGDRGKFKMADTNIDTETILNDTLATSNVDPAAKTRGRKKRVGKNAARERSRVQQLKMAFTNLQRSLPNVPEDTKLSRLDILLLAINYITHLKKILASTSNEEIGNESSGRQRQEESPADLQKKQKPLGINEVTKRSKLVAHSQWLYRSSLKRRISIPSTTLARDHVNIVDDNRQ